MTFYTVLEVARMLKVTPATVQKWIAAGKLPSFRIPGSKKHLIVKESIDTFLIRSTSTAVQAEGAAADIAGFFADHKSALARRRQRKRERPGESVKKESLSLRPTGRADLNFDFIFGRTYFDEFTT